MLVKGKKVIKLIKSYKFWTALAGSVGLLFTLISEHVGVNINAEGVKEIIMAICSVLVVFGIVKKPSQKQEAPQEINLNKNCGVSLNETNSNKKDE